MRGGVILCRFFFVVFFFVVVFTVFFVLVFVVVVFRLGLVRSMRRCNRAG